VQAAHSRPAAEDFAIHQRTSLESKSMSYLDVAPLISALRNTPEEFELSSGWLCHIRSWHSFRVGPGPEERVEIRAACNCVLLAVRPEQERHFAAGFREWQSAYWRPLEINREFAAHFGRRTRLLQWTIAATGGLHRWLLQRGRGRRGIGLPVSPAA
jgi:hypothetical protein